MSDCNDDALTGEDRGTTLRVVVSSGMLEVSGPELADAASDDVVLRLIPFDVVERNRDAHRRCGWNP